MSWLNQLQEQLNEIQAAVDNAVTSEILNLDQLAEQQETEQSKPGFILKISEVKNEESSTQSKPVHDVSFSMLDAPVFSEFDGEDASETKFSEMNASPSEYISAISAALTYPLMATEKEDKELIAPVNRMESELHTSADELSIQDPHQDPSELKLSEATQTLGGQGPLTTISNMSALTHESESRAIGINKHDIPLAHNRSSADINDSYTFGMSMPLRLMGIGSLFATEGTLSSAQSNTYHSFFEDDDDQIACTGPNVDPILEQVKRNATCHLQNAAVSPYNHADIMRRVEEGKARDVGEPFSTPAKASISLSQQGLQNLLRGIQSFSSPTVTHTGINTLSSQLQHTPISVAQRKDSVSSLLMPPQNPGQHNQLHPSVPIVSQEMDESSPSKQLYGDVSTSRGSACGAVFGTFHVVLYHAQCLIQTVADILVGILAVIVSVINAVVSPLQASLGSQTQFHFKTTKSVGSAAAGATASEYSYYQGRSWALVTSKRGLITLSGLLLIYAWRVTISEAETTSDAQLMQGTQVQRPHI